MLPSTRGYKRSVWCNIASKTKQLHLDLALFAGHSSVDFFPCSSYRTTPYYHRWDTKQAMATKDSARRVVQNIIKDHGFVREESLKTMLPEIRREVEEALLAKDKKIGSSVLTYATQLNDMAL